MSDFNENENENIRPPDNTIRETLVGYGNNSNYNNNYNINFNVSYNNYENIDIIPNDYDDYDESLQLAFIESIKEQEEYEKKQLEFLEKTRLRVQSFKDILLKIKKIGMIDKKISEFYNIIEQIIDSYCACNIDIYECDEVMYNEIFDTLKTIRITKPELSLFKSLFVIEN